MLLVLGGAALHRLAPRLPGLLGSDCTLQVAGEQVDLSREQARDLTTLAVVARRDGRTQEALAAAVERALADGGDDGEVAPADAARELGAAAARPRLRSVVLARALLGHGSDRLTCDADPAEVDVQQEGPGGLTPRADRARTRLLEASGRLPLGGFAPGGVSTGHTRGSAHYEGRAVDVFFRPVDAAQQRRGWTTAQWLVAHAEPLALDVLIYDRLIWSAARSAEGWRTYRPPAGPTTNPVLLHLDHIHLDVLRGS